MSQMQRTDQYRGSQRTGREPTGWVGWILFAGVMLILSGAIHLIEGFAALLNDKFFVVRPSGLVVNVDYTAWGWTMLGLGCLALGAGFGVMSGRMWARIFGIAVACVSAVGSLAFMAAYPLWGLTVVTVDVLVIWALALHGSETKRI